VKVDWLVGIVGLVGVGGGKGGLGEEGKTGAVEDVLVCGSDLEVEAVAAEAIAWRR